ncbi:MAG: tryptophan synthase alpha chain [Candidatus Azotimanducaceae bacterium]
MSLAMLRDVLATSPHHVSPFLMLGDPTPDICVALCLELVAAGATMLELGLPYADPCADGPAVQAAGIRARDAGVSTDEAIATLAAIRAACPNTPLNLLVYGNLVHARGFDHFCRDVVDAGASSMLVPDIPLEEGAALRAAATDHGLGNVLFAGPRTRDERLRAIAAASSAFVYLAGHQGVTGAKSGGEDRAVMVARVRRQVAVPLCVGFGLSTREHMQTVHGSGAEIAVVGSHLLRVLARALDHHASQEQLLAAVRSAFEELLPAQRRSQETPSCS